MIQTVIPLGKSLHAVATYSDSLASQASAALAQPFASGIDEFMENVAWLKKESNGDQVVAVALASIRGWDYMIDNVKGHGFHSKPIERHKQEGGRVTISGQLSHMRSGEVDDQLYYVIEKANNTITSITARVDPGGIGVILGPVAAVIGLYFGVILDPRVIAKIVEQTEAAVTREWRDVANAIIVNVAVREPSYDHA